MIPEDISVLSLYLIGSDLYVNNLKKSQVSVRCGFRTVFDKFLHLLHESEGTFRMDTTQPCEKKKWWERRYELDRVLGELLGGLKLDVMLSERNALLVGAEISNFPFEACEVFGGRAVFRIPSLSYLKRVSSNMCPSEPCLHHAVVHGGMQHNAAVPNGALFLPEGSTSGAETVGDAVFAYPSWQEAAQRPKKLPICSGMVRENVFYLLDPLNNLRKSQNRLRPLLSGFLGVFGRLLTEEELNIARSVQTLSVLWTWEWIQISEGL